MAGADALVQVFNDVDLAKTSAQQLWQQVSPNHSGSGTLYAK